MLRPHKKKLQTAVLATLALLSFSGCNGFSPVGEAEDSYASNLGYFNVKFYNAGETTDAWGETSTYTLDPWQKQHILYAVNYWEHVLAPGLQPSVASDVTVITYDVDNAFAASIPVAIGTDNPPLAMNLLACLLQGYGTEYADLATLIGIGQPLYPTGMPESEFLTPLCTEENGTLANTMVHEMGHALGISSATEEYFFANANHTFNSHLYDWRGQQVQPGLEMKTLEHTPAGTTYFDLPGYSKLADDNTNKLPYFSGEHVAEVLNGAKMTVYSSRGTVMNQDPVPGVPINGVEYLPSDQGGFEEFIDLSHIELRNSMMSHQRFRNYFVFMEAELAMLQDIGYTIDRRDFYGSSIYGNGLTVYNRNPYYARNEEGSAYLTNTYNSNDFGIGLHVYGSRNKVYQEADLLTDGVAGVGIRVDGTDNNIIVESGVHVQADGLNGNGLLVAFGKNHNILLAEDSVVTANGQGGIGADFNFGRNEIGHSMGARASYGAWSYMLTNQLLDAASVEVDGPLVNSFTVDGVLQGSKAAMHMADNAYVKNVTIGDTALIKGDIHNEWLYDYDDIVSAGGAIDSLLYRQYTGSDELTTTLSINGNLYNGDIIGKKNTRVSFAKGTNEYTGKAQVLSVDVVKGASLEGSGTYDLMTPDDAAQHTLNYRLLESEAQDARQLSGVGLFTNHGLVAPTAGEITIKGDFVSDGTLGLATTAGGTKANSIAVSGTADISGTKFSAMNKMAYLPDISYTFLRAEQGVNGAFATNVNTPFTGFLNLASLQTDGQSAAATLSLANNMGSLTDSQQSVYDNLGNLVNAAQGNSDKLGQVGYLLGIRDKAEGKKVLNNLTGNNRPNTAAMNMINTSVYDALWARENGDTIPWDISTDRNVWVKTSKSWTSIDSGSTTGNRFSAVLGADKKLGKHWDAGALFAYTKNSYNGDGSTAENNDYRIGLYGLYQNRAGEGFVYVAGGRQNNDASRHFQADTFYKATGDFKSTTWEAGGRYAYDLDYDKQSGWHNKPFGALRAVHYNQESYNEDGAGIWNLHTGSDSTFYSAATLGWGLSQKLKDGHVGMGIGYKRVLSGSNPDSSLRFDALPNSSLVSEHNGLDKNLFVVGINGAQKLPHNWAISGSLLHERGANDHGTTAAVSLKKTW